MISTAPAPSLRKTFSWPNWLTLILVVLLTIVAIVSAFLLRQYANDRRDVMERLEQLETMAIEQSRLMWQTLGEQDNLTAVRLKGEAQQGRGEIALHLEELYALEQRSSWLDGLFSHQGGVSAIESLESYTLNFTSNVQGVLNMMSISSIDRLRDRFRFGDPQFEALQEEINFVSREASLTAARANTVSNASILVAALVTLAASFWGTLRMGQMRARRELDLLTERSETLRASEARFKALIQNSSDLIAVLEPDERVRYASPASETMLGLTAEALVGQPFWQTFDLDDAPTKPELRFESAEVKRDLELHLNPMLNHPDVKGTVVTIRDVSERKAFEAQLKHQALHDPLTDLPNRRKFKESLELAMQKEGAFSVLFIDLDGFKLVNDSYGHRAGDQLLKDVAVRMKTCLTEQDVLARQGGDEFIILLASADESLALTTAERILKTLEPPFKLLENELFVTASIGVSNGTESQDADDLVQKADIAMYYAKQNGKAKAALFVPDMAQQAPDRLDLQNDFKRGLERGEFSVYYQPKVGFQSGKTESLEALVRWIHPEKGRIGPDLFIPFAEETGLIEPLGKLILETACRDAASWQKHGVIVAVNLSPLQFRNPDLVSEVRDAINSSGLDPKYLELEITESAVLGDISATIEVLKELKALGLRLAIDDFGTGYSNLSHLKHFDVDVLKIDQSFVRGGNPSSDALSDGPIVSAVIAMAKAFGLHVVAEGVETSMHAEQLKDMGCDLGQGYYYSKPVEKDFITERLEKESQA